MALTLNRGDDLGEGDVSKIADDIHLLLRVTEKDVEREGRFASVMVRAGLLLDALDVSTAIERALRIRIWNECKARGLHDGPAYRHVEEAISAIYASALEARQGTDPERGRIGVADNIATDEVRDAHPSIEGSSHE